MLPGATTRCGPVIRCSPVSGKTVLPAGYGAVSRIRIHPCRPDTIPHNGDGAAHRAESPARNISCKLPLLAPRPTEVPRSHARSVSPRRGIRGSRQSRGLGPVIQRIPLQAEMTSNPPFQTIYFDIVGGCVARCPYCLTGIGETGKGGEITPERFAEALRKLRDGGAIGAKTVVSMYNWGEPFLHSDFPGILRVVNNLGVR